jgi:hypothetical protein
MPCRKRCVRKAASLRPSSNGGPHAGSVLQRSIRQRLLRDRRTRALSFSGTLRMGETQVRQVPAQPVEHDDPSSGPDRASVDVGAVQPRRVWRDGGAGRARAGGRRLNESTRAATWTPHVIDVTPPWPTRAARSCGALLRLTFRAWFCVLQEPRGRKAPACPLELDG